MTQEFNPSDLFKQLSENNLDPSIFNTIDETRFPKAPNFLEWAVGPQFLNTLILPRQVEIGTKLFNEYCPDCSNPGYIDTLFDQSIGNIKSNVVFLEHGVCPKCKTTRWELFKNKKLIFRNELVAAAGQRCVHKDSLVFTDRGILPMADVLENDVLSHGPAIKKIDSGFLPSLRVTTKFNYTMVGAKESHIVPVIKKQEWFDNLTKHQRQKRKFKQEVQVEFIHLKDCQVGDHLLLHKSNLWAKEPYQLGDFEYVPLPGGYNTKNFTFPNVVTPELARLTGYLVADGQYTREYNLRIMTSNADTEEDVKRCCLAVFGEEPALEEARKFKYKDDHYKQWSVNGKAVMQWLDFIGLKPAKHRDKEIPAFILQSPKEIVCEFLAGLFGADGNIYYDKGAIRIQYSSVAKKLIKQLRVILLNLGIVTRCDKNESPKYGESCDYSKEPEDGKESYWVATKDSNYVEIFKNNIRLVEKKKLETLAKNKTCGYTRYYTPYGAFQSNKYEKWPKSLQALVEQGYYPVPIEKIEDGPVVDMADVMVPNTNMFTADNFCHHNSGKSKLIAMIANYVNHLFLKIPNPLRAFNQTSGEMLLGTFSGLTLDQCHRNLWNPFRAFMDASPWFQSYHRFLREHEKKLGLELFHELQNSITYLHKNIHWYSTGSEARKMRGDTRIFAAIDELGWMVADETKPNLLMMNADAVYTALANSLTTMRTKWKQVFKEDNFDVPPIVMGNISSPSSAKDKIMRLSKDAKKNDRMLSFHLPTWEMNPDFSYDSLREEFSHMDELSFNRDFGAEPPLAANPFLSEARMVDKIANQNHFKGIEVKVITKEDNFGDLFKTAELQIIKGDKLVPRMITFDLGFRKNSLAFCMFSLSPESKPKLDMALVVSPEPERRLRVNVVDFFESFTVPLVENFKIKHAFFDRWQSLDQIERLKILNVDARMHSLSYKEMESVRGSIISQSICMPTMEKPMSDYVKDYVDDQPITDPIPLLGIQLLTVRDMGHKMTKPLLGDDDLFRAFALGVVNISNPDFKKQYGEAAELKTGHRVAHLGTVRQSSFGSGMGYGGMSTIEGEGGRTLGTIRGQKRR